MTNLKNSTEGLKTGTGSPVRTPRKKQEEILAALARSGMTKRQFAASEGMRFSTLVRWAGKARRREKEAGASRQVPKVNWVEAVAENANEDDRLNIDLGGGVRLQVGTPRQAALAGEIIRALGVVRQC